jgi:hypothetical protein
MRLPLVGLVLAGLLVSLSSARSADEKPVRVLETKGGQPTVILRFASLDALIADARYLVDLVGEAEKAKQIEGVLKALTSEKGLEGVDTTKPFGLYAQLTADVPSSPYAFVLPVSDEKALLKLLDQRNVGGEKDKDGIYTVNLPGSPVPAHYRFANKHVYVVVGPKTALAKEKLLLPEKIFAGNDSSTVSLTINIDEIPESVRDLVLGQVSLQAAAAKAEKKKDESPVLKKFRGALLDEIADLAKGFLKEGKSVRFSLDIDRQGGDLSTSVVLTARPGSGLADTISNLGKSKSVSASLIDPQSALSYAVHASLPEALRKALDPVIEEGVNAARKQKMPEDQKELVEALLKAVLPTIKMAEIDSGVSVRGPNAKGLYTLVMGLKVKEGTEIESAVKDLVKKAPKDKQGQVTFDVAKVGNTNIHKLTQDKEDEKAKKLLGDNPVYVAAREDALFLAAGADGLAALKEVLATAPKNGNVVQFEAALGRLAPFMANENKNAAAAAAKAFAKDKNSDRVSLLIEGGNVLRFRASAKAQILRFVAIMEEMKNKEL